VPLTFEIARRGPQVGECYRIRDEVFIREQQVPREIERDAYDLAAEHVLIRDGKEAVATGRLVTLDPGDEPSGEEGPWGRIGRMAVLASHRGRGVGRFLLECLENIAREKRLAGIVLHAQKHAEGFYDKAGYEVSGEEFEEAGIPHVEMRKRLRD
jgi:predicted GNAT family N-acyltransferase